jgi:hypothetical protein
VLPVRVVAVVCFAFLSLRWWRLSPPGVDPLDVLGVRGLDQVVVAPAGVPVVTEHRAAGVQGARDVVGAASGHDRVVVALDDQHRRARPEHGWIVGGKNLQQGTEIGAGTEYLGGHQRCWPARGAEIVDADDLSFGQQAQSGRGEQLVHAHGVVGGRGADQDQGEQA